MTRFSVVIWVWERPYTLEGIGRGKHLEADTRKHVKNNLSFSLWMGGPGYDLSKVESQIKRLILFSTQWGAFQTFSACN